jgi:hypothetical protein
VSPSSFTYESKDTMMMTDSDGFDEIVAAAADDQYDLTTAPAPELVDPYDPDSLRSTALDDIGVTHEVLSVAVRKPRRSEFFRVHPTMHLDAYVLEYREGDTPPVTYLVTARYRAALLAELSHVRLFCCISKVGAQFIWPARIPGESRFAGRWHETAMLAAEKASISWVRMFSNNGAYDIHLAQGDLGAPNWPDRDLRGWLALAFRGDGLIDSPDHPVLRALSGEL